MSGQAMASVDDLEIWAAGIINERAPDFVIGDNYLRRWWIVPRNPLQNVYLHEINKSDDERAMHDHPWTNTSLIIKGSYIEHTPEGVFKRKAGDVIHRPAEALHRLEIADTSSVISLFLTGPVVREWGFACPQGWRHWKEFTSFAENGTSGQVGRGCD